MKKIFDWIKNFKYKGITALVILILTQVIYYTMDIVWVSYISLVAFLYLIVRIYTAIYHGIKNTYKDGDKGFAILVAVLVILMTIGFIILTLTNL